MPKRNASDGLEGARSKAQKHTAVASTSGSTSPTTNADKHAEINANTQDRPRTQSRDLETPDGHHRPESTLVQQFLSTLVVACEHRRLSTKMIHAADDAELDLDLAFDLRMEALVNEIATKWNPAMAQNSELDIFSIDCLMSFTSVIRFENTATRLEEELDQAKTELADLQDRRESAIRKRCQSQLKARKATQDIERIRALASEHALELKATDDLLHISSRRFKNAEREYEEARHSLLHGFDETLAAADQALVAAGFLEHPEDDTTHEEQNNFEQPSAPDEAANSRHHHQARQNTDSNRPVSRSVFHPPSQRDLVRQQCRREPDNAKRDMSEASRDFDRLRDGYDMRLKDFYNDRDNGRVTGTKTDFDADYFLARNDTNQRLALAEDRLYRAKRIAQDAGVLPALEQSSNFADRSDDGCQEEERLAIALLDRDRVERWRRDEAQKEIEPVGVAWESRLVDHSPDRGSIAAISSRSQDRYDTSRRSKLIAQWKKQQGEGFAVEDQRRLRWKTIHRA